MPGEKASDFPSKAGKQSVLQHACLHLQPPISFALDHSFPVHTLGELGIAVDWVIVVMAVNLCASTLRQLYSSHREKSSTFLEYTAVNQLHRNNLVE